MTSHGYFGLCAGSEISDDVIAKIACQISEIPEVIEVHVVKGSNYNIIVRFTHLKNITTPEELLREKILKIKVKGKSIHEPIDYWIIYQTFQNGRELTEEEERGKHE